MKLSTWPGHTIRALFLVVPSLFHQQRSNLALRPFAFALEPMGRLLHQGLSRIVQKACICQRLANR